MMTIETAAGTIEGVARDGVLEFRGVRFAEPPVGELRFRPPVRTSGWSGVLDATEYGHRSVQAPPPEVLGGEGPGTPDEDCLFLNITTPAADDASPAGAVLDPRRGLRARLGQRLPGGILGGAPTTSWW